MGWRECKGCVDEVDVLNSIERRKRRDQQPEVCEEEQVEEEEKHQHVVPPNPALKSAFKVS